MEKYKQEQEDETKLADNIIERLEKELGKNELVRVIHSGMIEVAMEEADSFDNTFGLDRDEEYYWSDEDYANWDEHIRDIMYDDRSNTDDGAYGEIVRYLTEEELKVDWSYLGKGLRIYWRRFN